MKSFISLVCAIEFIESNLRTRIAVGDVAEAAYLSLSHLQGMFARTLHISVGDYVAKRKLCLAARDLIDSDASVTDIAFDFGYANVESFSRAFKKQFLHTPSVYRRRYRFSELYPRLLVDEKEGFNRVKSYDLTSISEKILASKGTYIICADIDHLMTINEQLGHAAGDAAIAETAARIDASVEPGMDYVRAGGDHFVILTGSKDIAVSEGIAERIIALAEQDVVWSGGTFRFSVSMGIVRIPTDIQDAKETIERSERAMIAAKQACRNSYKVM